LTVLSLATAPALDQMWFGWGHHPWLWGGVFFVLGWLIIIGLVVLLVRAFSGPRPAKPQSDAERILAERYAKGEIDEAEYRARLTVLKENRPS
jgi:putative membrane protein